MKCYYIDSVNGKTVFEPREAPVPQPKKGELLVRLRASSLNRGEILASIGFHAVHEARPAGGDCAGEVEAVGEGVTAFKKGDRVFGRARGSFAEYAVMSVEQAAPVPARLSWEEAAAVPVAAITAYEAIVAMGRLKAGETLLVVGAASGVGMFGVQAGKYLGAKVIGTSRSAREAREIEARGHGRRHSCRGRRLCGRGAEGDGRQGRRSRDQPRRRQRVSRLRALAREQGATRHHRLRGRHAQGRSGPGNRARQAAADLRRVERAHVRARTGRKRCGGFIRDLLPGFAEGKITPIVDKVFPFHELPAAKAYVESNAQMGKVVVKMP